MTLKSQNNQDENRKTQMKIQNKEIAETLRHIKNKILVMSGKGGVGKSSVAAYFSVALAKKGFRVGLMDVDLHGPSLLDNEALLITQEFNKMVVEIVGLTDSGASSAGYNDRDDAGIKIGTG